MEKKSQVSKIQEGDFLSETQYYQVVKVAPTSIEVKNERNFTFHVGNAIVEEGMYSASQFNEVQEITRTELIEIFRLVGDTVFTVSFNKLPEIKDINDAIEGLNDGRILPVKEMKARVKEAFKGKERILTGYLVKTETGFGRSVVIDLEIDKGSNPEYDNRLRQVDHRTLNWLIYKNVKYQVKSK